MKIKLFLFYLIIGLMFLVSSCKGLKDSRLTVIEDKNNKDQQKEAKKYYEELQKKHYNIQTTEAKKQMKETKKRSKYYNRKKSKSFFQKIFGQGSGNKK